MSRLKAGVTLMVCLLCLVTTGCSSRLGQEELTVRQNAPPEANEHSLMIVTTRGRSQTRAALFSRERSTRTDYAKALISVPSEHADGRPGATSNSPEGRQSQVTVRETDYFESDDAFVSELNTRAQRLSGDNREVILFVHGYNTRFPEAVYRFAQFFHDLDQPAVPVLFSWASGGRLRDYIYDLNSAAIARDALAKTLVELSESSVDRISIVAHSTGSWLFMETMRQLPRHELRQIAGKLETVVLAAPDIDVDAFKASLRKIGRPPVLYFVIVSQDDQALRLSRILAGGIERVGTYSNDDELVELGAIVIDATDLEDGNFVNHTKFAGLARHAARIQQVLVTDHLDKDTGPVATIPVLGGVLSITGG